MTVKKAARMNVDAVTGATFSSRALVKNVQAGLEYYQKQK
jgi:electron transport complex protein RnfG